MEFPRISHTLRIPTFNFNNIKLFKIPSIKKDMTNENFFKKPLVIGAIGIISLFSGFYFLGNKITGNIIIEKEASFSLLPFIGLLLIACSAVLIIYSIKKR